VELHPDIRIRALTICSEQAPLLVVDNFAADPEAVKVRSGAGSLVPGKQTLAARLLLDMRFGRIRR
jgi:hypothetical protein